MKAHAAHKPRMFTTVIAMTLFAALALPLIWPAQEQKEGKNEHHHYKLIDMGTFGGPTSLFSNPDSRADKCKVEEAS